MATIQLFFCSTKAAIDSTRTNECGYATIKFYLQKQAAGHSLPTSVPDGHFLSVLFFAILIFTVMSFSWQANIKNKIYISLPDNWSFSVLCHSFPVIYCWECELEKIVPWDIHGGILCDLINIS